MYIICFLCQCLYKVLFEKNSYLKKIEADGKRDEDWNFEEMASWKRVAVKCSFVEVSDYKLTEAQIL